MPILRKPPRGRRRANLQIDYRFDRVAYTRWRLRCWGEAGLDRGEATARRVVAAALRLPRWIREGVPALRSARAGRDRPVAESAS